VASFDYGNARLRAKISRMLSIESLESLADLKTIDRLISALVKTSYQRSIEHGLTITHGLACLQEAFDFELEQMTKDLLRFYQDEAQKEIQILLEQQDLKNVKVILRGIYQKVNYEDIIGSLSGIGTIPINTLSQLARSTSLQELFSKMLVFHLSESEPLFLHLSEINNIPLSKLEMVLEKWFFKNILEEFNRQGEKAWLFREYFAIEADITNLNTVLRFLSSPESRIVIQENIEEFFVEPGHISRNELKHILEKGNLSRKIFKVKYSNYNPFLAHAQDSFNKDHLLSNFENWMEVYKLNWAARLSSRYPLGIGVPISYIVRKISEARNLRWISHSINFGINPEYIKANLMRVI